MGATQAIDLGTIEMQLQSNTQSEIKLNLQQKSDFKAETRKHL